MEWWKPDLETRRALRRWSQANPVKREKPPRWMQEEEFDREFGGEVEEAGCVSKALDT